MVTCLPSFPQIITEPHNQTVNISSSTTLTCHVVDLGDHHVTWFKTDPLTSLSSPLAVGKQLFTTDPRYSVSFYSTSSRDSFWSLEIYHVTMNDRGNYTCRIANRKASVSVTIELNVVLPMFLTPNEYHVEIGKSIEFNCTVFVVDQSILMNNPLSYLTWHHSSDSPIQSQFHDIQIQKSYLDNVLTSKLLINRTEIEHSGRWTCNFRDQQLTSKVLVEKCLSEFKNETLSFDMLMIMFFFSRCSSATTRQCARFKSNVSIVRLVLLVCVCCILGH